MYKILHTLPALDGGGAERIVYDYVIRMLDEFHFDFIVHTDKEGILERDLIKKGCTIFHIPSMHKNKKEYKKQINDILKNGKYDVIHVSQGYRGLYFLKYAKKYKIKVRIAHSHMAYIPENFKQKIIRKITTILCKYYASDLFACSDDAGRWMWGKKTYKNNKIFIMKNGIDTSKFVFNENARNLLRNKFGINDNTFVIGCVARFSYQKNHEFLINVFNEVLKLCSNSKLILIGSGELENDIQSQIVKLNIGNEVICTGVVSNTYDYYNIFDLFLLPSRYEGLGVVLIEAQVNGLHCITTTTTPKAANIDNNVEFWDLNLDAKSWAKKISQLTKKRKNISSNVFLYDINNCVNALAQFYKQGLEK